MSEDRDGERAALIESRLNMDRAAGIETQPFLGLSPKDLSQVYEFAKGMALSGPMVPAFCRNQPWACVGVIMQSMEWRMSPWTVARQAYMVKSRRTGDQTIAYQSQLLHAVLENRAPTKERLRVRYEGEGDDRVCIVSGTFKGEEEAREWKSPRLGDRRPVRRTRNASRDPRDAEDGINEEEQVSAGSPLWYTKPDVQLFYDTSRDWARVYCPDIVMGIYGRDEMDESGFVDVTPTPATPIDDGGAFTKRLSEQALARAGFNAEAVAAAIDGGRPKPDARDGSAAAADPSPADADQGGEVASSGSSPPPHTEAPEGPQTAEEASGPSDTGQAPEPTQRPSRARRRPPQPDQPGLV